jgi:hypothetical protein
VRGSALGQAVLVGEDDELHAGPDGEHFRVRAFLPTTATAAVPLVQSAGGAS